jgi:hypothetical protein
MSCSDKEQTNIIFILENGKVEVKKFKVCETDYGFQISVEKSLQQKVSAQKIKTFILEKGKRKIEIKPFNILYSPPENYSYKAPTTPKGSLAFFEDGDNLTIEILSNSKTELISLIGKDYVLKCASH